MPVTEKFDRPLIVIVHKFDAWRPLLRKSPSALDDVIRAGQNGVSCLHLDSLMEVSRDIEELLLEHGPSIVTAARGFASEVVFIPVTATGRSPIVAESDSNGRVDLLFDPSQISPRWVELPVFYALHRAGLRTGNVSLIPAAAVPAPVPAVPVPAKNNGRKERGS